MKILIHLNVLLLTLFIVACGSQSEDGGDANDETTDTTAMETTPVETLPVADEGSLQVPQAVLASFQSAYPNITDAKWEMEGDQYEVEYEEDGVEKEIIYHEGGNVVATETQIDKSELMASITDYISENYPDHMIQEAEAEENTEGKFYNVELSADKVELEVRFDSDGNFIGEEKDGTDTDDDDEDDGDNGDE